MNDPSRPLCALTGSRGFLGSRLKAFFIAHGWDVLELTRQPGAGTNAVAFRLGETVSPDRLSNVQCLIHCAYDFRPRSWDEIHAVNVVGARKLFDAAADAGVPRIICISTISAFDGASSLYGKAKFEIEQEAVSRGAFVVRPGLIYGNEAGGMFGSLVASVRAARIVPLVGDGRQKQYLVHVEDLAGLLLRFASGEFAGNGVRVTAAHPQPWPLRSILLAIAGRFGRSIRFLPIPWRLVWSGLRGAELAGVPLGFRSDSVISLIFQDPSPDFSSARISGQSFRAFDVTSLMLDTRPHETA